MAGVVGALLLMQVAWESRRSNRRLLAKLALLCLPFLLIVGARAASVGVESALPFLRTAAQRASVTLPAAANGAPSPSAARALPAFLQALFSSGNAGILYWVLPVAVALQFARVLRARTVWALGAVMLLLLQAAFSSVWLFPEYTLNQSTVHRQLLPVSIAAALWLASILAGEANETDGQEAR